MKYLWHRTQHHERGSLRTLFVGVLGASRLTYADATLTQRVPDFLGSHVRMFEYFGGVPQLVVPDQLKSAVTIPSRSEPVIQRTYADLGRHHGTAIMPARPRKPRDKAKEEVAVQIAQRWILARLRNETFFSLAALIARSRELVHELNRRSATSLASGGPPRCMATITWRSIATTTRRRTCFTASGWTYA